MKYEFDEGIFYIIEQTLDRNSGVAPSGDTLHFIEKLLSKFNVSLKKTLFEEHKDDLMSQYVNVGDLKPTEPLDWKKYVFPFKSPLFHERQQELRTKALELALSSFGGNVALDDDDVVKTAQRFYTYITKGE